MIAVVDVVLEEIYVCKRKNIIYKEKKEHYYINYKFKSTQFLLS